MCRLLQRGSGFTIIEMMVTLAVAAALILLAAPAMSTLIQNQQARTAASELHGALNFARSEALKRGVSIDIVPASGDWKNGWTVQLPDGTALRSWPPLNPNLASITTATITYRPDGHTTAAAAAMVVRSASNTQVTARCVSADLSGRPALVTDTDGNAGNGCQPQ